MNTSDASNYNVMDFQLEELQEKYEILKLLGEGSNGRTWLAKQRDSGCLVAIKSLKFSDDEKQLELFKREAHTLQSLKVNGIPRFFESIIPENPLKGVCYIVQEYIELQSLQSYLDEGKTFSEKKTLIFIEKLTRILKVLQDQYVPPIIHRDIKPSNILSPYDFNQNSPFYLIDFGAVANPQKKNGGSTIAGTFGYMAPEQLLGDVTIQSDYFAMGATAIHLLTGVPPSSITSNVYRLNIDKVIRRHAPKTSKPMLHLLHWLLEPSVADRPKNTAVILKAISAVAAKKDFVIGSKMEYPDVFGESFGKTSLSHFFHNMFNKEPTLAKDADFFLDPKVWIKTNGTLRHITEMLITSPEVFRFFHRRKKENSHDYKKYFEYTFTVDGQSYVGLTEIKDEHLLNNIDTIKLPSKCEVQYNPKDPRMNTMIPDFESNIEN